MSRVGKVKSPYLLVVSVCHFSFSRWLFAPKMSPLPCRVLYECSDLQFPYTHLLSPNLVSGLTSIFRAANIPQWEEGKRSSQSFTRITALTHHSIRLYYEIHHKPPLLQFEANISLLCTAITSLADLAPVGIEDTDTKSCPPTTFNRLLSTTLPHNKYRTPSIDWCSSKLLSYPHRSPA